MRLFTAIIFDEVIENSLYQIVEQLKKVADKGTFTAKENLHLTVNFIGETERLEEVKQAMRRAVNFAGTERFQITIGGVGKFKRREGDIFWVGVDKAPSLWKLQKQMVRELREAGFYDIDDMEYTPHMTIGRRVRVKAEFDSIKFEEKMEAMKMEAYRLSLMNSERIQGKLVYTEIYHVNFEKRENYL